jgi:hypothetical protein
MQHRFLSMTFGAVTIVGIAMFLAFVAAADRAMDKTGFGDPIRHGELSGYASISFYLALSTWLLCVVFSQLAPQPYRSRALFWFGLVVPLVGMVSWFLRLGTTGA